MNKVVMVVWGLVITSMCTLIFAIGYKEQDRVYINLTKEIKQAGKLYVKDNRISMKIGDSKIISIDDLVKGQYIEKNEKIDEYCIEGVIYTNEILKDTYTIRINCESKEKNE